MAKRMSRKAALEGLLDVALRTVAEQAREISLLKFKLEEAQRG